MKEQNIPGICGIDTRDLTKKLRESGSILGRIVQGVPKPGPERPFSNPNERNLVAEVSITVIYYNYFLVKIELFHKLKINFNLFQKPTIYNNSGDPFICVVDCGLKYNQIRCLLKRNAKVEVVPWNHPIDMKKYDGLFLSNGPGDPSLCKEPVIQIRNILNSNIKKPIFGICFGHQILATAIGCKTYKMK